MSAADRAAALRQQAEALDELGELEDAAAKAKAAYQEKQTPQRKEAHRAASQALADARQAVREAGVIQAPEPGGTTVLPGTVGKAG